MPEAPSAGAVPALRVRALNAAQERAQGDFVLLWPTAVRRLGWSFAAQRAAERAARLRKPLVVLDALRAGYPYASDRLHAFAIAGIAEHARALDGGPALHLPYVEPRPGAGRGLLAALARRACLVVADDAPWFFFPRMLAAAARQARCRLEAVDGHGLLPYRAAGRAWPTARGFRGFLARTLPQHLGAWPAPEPLDVVALPSPRSLDLAAIRKRWPAPSEALLRCEPGALAALPIAHDVAPVAEVPGGPAAGRTALRAFLARKLEVYADARNHPDADATSGLSPYLHWGHVGAHEVVAAIAAEQGWEPAQLRPPAKRAQGWMARRSLDADTSAFLDQLVVWRELSLNGAAHLAHHDRFRSLPAWARATLAKHARDPREPRYDLATLRDAATYDEVWNAAQRQLLRQGRIHNYLRMLWGKKILEWAPDPRTAFAWALELNDRYALDGRDANSVAGVAWCFGRYDRAWGPERAIVGTVRYMSSARTEQKLRLRRYLARFGPAREDAPRAPGPAEGGRQLEGGGQVEEGQPRRDDAGAPGAPLPDAPAARPRRPARSKGAGGRASQSP